MCQHNSNCGCGCYQAPCPGNCCSKTKTDNIMYSGPNLSCSGVNINDDLTTVIQKLSTIACSGGASTTTTSTTANCYFWKANISVIDNQYPTVIVVESTFGETGYAVGRDTDTGRFIITLIGAIPVMDNTTLLTSGKFPSFFSVSVSGNTISFGAPDDIESGTIIIQHCNTLPPPVPITAIVYSFAVGQISTVLSCAEAEYPLSLYSADLLLAIGSVMYTDPELSVPFNGGDLYFQSGLDFVTMQINSSGVITDIILC